MPSTQVVATRPGDALGEKSSLASLVNPVWYAQRVEIEAPAECSEAAGAPVKFQPAVFIVALRSTHDLPVAWCSWARSAATGTSSWPQSGPENLPCLQWSCANRSWGTPDELNVQMSTNFGPPPRLAANNLLAPFTKGAAHLESAIRFVGEGVRFGIRCAGF